MYGNIITFYLRFTTKIKFTNEYDRIAEASYCCPAEYQMFEVSSTSFRAGYSISGSLYFLGLQAGSIEIQAGTSLGITGTFISQKRPAGS